MKFNDFRGVTEDLKDSQLIGFCEFLETRANRGSQLAVAVESLWRAIGRPYYRLWPSIIPMLAKLDISKVKAGMLSLPERVVCFYLPVEVNHHGIKSFLFHLETKQTAQGSPRMNIAVVIDGHDLPGPLHLALTVSRDATIGEAIDSAKEHAQYGILREVLTLGCACSMLDDSMLIPDVLDRDRGKPLTETILARARRYKKGWLIGQSIELIPHVRRPHPALMWTGPGRKIPKVVMRSGSVIHREVVKRLPTGYEGKE